MARFEKFWDVICEYQPYLRLGFMVSLFLFILTVLSLWFAEPGTNAYAISVLNFAMIGILGAVLAWMNRVCAKRARRYY